MKAYFVYGCFRNHLCMTELKWLADIADGLWNKRWTDFFFPWRDGMTLNCGKLCILSLVSLFLRCCLVINFIGYNWKSPRWTVYHGWWLLIKMIFLSSDDGYGMGADGLFVLHVFLRGRLKNSVKEDVTPFIL